MTQHKLYYTQLVVDVYFTAPENADKQVLDRACADAVRTAMRDESPYNADPPKLVKAGDPVEGVWDSSCLVYGSHGFDLTLGEAMNQIPGHKEQIEKFKQILTKVKNENEN